MAESSEPQSAAPPPPPAPVEVRWSWGQYPSNRIDSNRMVVPLGCLYTPLAGPAPKLPYAPLRCGSCTGVLNNECQVDHRSKTWQCPFCKTRNNFPQSWANMSEHHLPAELMKQYSTVEYVQEVPNRVPPTFVLVVDTCVDTNEEAEHLKTCLALVLSKIPQSARVALITYGTTVQLHDLTGATEFARALVMRGSSEVTPEGIKKLVKRPERYVCNFSDAEFTITSIIEDLEIDCWPVQKDHRPLRCTGAAISAAASLLELVAPKSGGAVMAFLSGVCTEGPGKVVELARENLIRGHSDIKDNLAAAKYYGQSYAFFENLMRRMVTQGHALHLVQAALDQCGIAEMKPAVQATGGVFITSDSWKRQPLKQSLTRFLQRSEDGELTLGMNATMDVITSPTWKVMGCIGQCIGTGKRSNSVAETEVGMGGTCQWTSCSVDSRSTFAVYVETAANVQGAQGQTQSRGVPNFRHIQLITKYQQGTREHLRVTTLAHQAMDTVNFNEIANTFDQEAAAVLMARIAMHKADTTPVLDVLRWLDRHTIRLVSKFGEYTKDQPQTLRLSPRFSAFPMFMFHLRRSPYLQVFNNSPDETAALRVLLLKSNSPDSIIMIHPTLNSFTLGQQPGPVPLDNTSQHFDNVLLLDTFFEVLIHHGEQVKAWRGAGYEENPQYEHFKQFLDGIRAEAMALAEARFPAPQVIECSIGDPQARILYNRLNPSKTHKEGGGYGANPGELVYTDDASLQKYMDHLKKLAVQPM